MTTIAELLDDFRAQEEFVSGEIKEVPEFLQGQVNNTNTVLLDCVFSRNNDQRELKLILDKDFVSKLDLSTVNCKNLIDELLFCSCNTDGLIGCIDGLENLGDPATYYVEPATSQGRRIKAFPTAQIEMTAELDALLTAIKQLPTVTKVEVEYSRQKNITEKVGADDAVVISVYRDSIHIPVFVYYSLSVLLDRVSKDGIVDNITKLLDQFAIV